MELKSILACLPMEQAEQVRLFAEQLANETLEKSKSSIESAYSKVVKTITSFINDCEKTGYDAEIIVDSKSAKLVVSTSNGDIVVEKRIMTDNAVIKLGTDIDKFVKDYTDTDENGKTVLLKLGESEDRQVELLDRLLMLNDTDAKTSKELLSHITPILEFNKVK